MMIRSPSTSLLFFLFATLCIIHVKARPRDAREEDSDSYEYAFESFELTDTEIVTEIVTIEVPEIDITEPTTGPIEVEKLIGQKNDILEKSLGPVNSALNAIAHRGDDIIKKLSDDHPKEAKELKAAFDQTKHLFDVKFDTLPDFVDVLNILKSIFTKIMAILMKLPDSYKTLVTPLTFYIPPANDAIGVALGALSALITAPTDMPEVESGGPLLIENLIGKNIPALQLLLEPVNAVLNTILNLGEGVVTKLVGSQHRTAADIQKIFRKIRALLRVKIASPAVLADVLDRLMQLLEMLVRVTKDLPADLADFAGTIDLQVGAANVAIKSLSLALRALGGLTGLISDTFGYVTGGVSAIAQGAGAALQGAGAAATNLVSNIFG